MSNPNKKDQTQATCDMENFKMIASHFRQDLREFWNRANFYLITNAGLLSAFLIVYPGIIKANVGIVIVFPLVGLVIAVLWFLVLRGALHWIEKWREEVIRLSKELDRFRCYANIESSVKQNRSSSPSYLTQFLPLVFVVAWVLLLLIVLVEVA